MIAPDGVSFRPARAEDLDALTALYNHYVLTSHITFDVRPFTPDQRRAWFEGFGASGPHRLLVAQEGGRIAGYASSARFRPKPGYDTTVETTISMDPEFTGRGLGKRLYTVLIDTVRETPGIHRALAGIALPNETSRALHLALGFRPIGTFTQVGRKFDRYWDVEWFERDIG